MAFVYIHIIWFVRVEKYPFGLLTMMVLPEAIFLSPFRDDLSESRRRQAPGDRRPATLRLPKEVRSMVGRGL